VNTEEREACWQRIFQQLQENAELLRTRGTLVVQHRKKSAFWYVRFCVYPDGQRTQCSIYIGSDTQLVERTRALLEFYRRQSQWPQEATAASRVLGRIVACLHRPDRRRRPVSMGRP